MALSWHMWDAHTCCFFTGAKRGAENHVKQSQTFGLRFHRSHSPVPYAELGCLLSAGRYQGDWASQAWSASCEGYIPQKVKAQIKPLCKMSTVPAEVLWNLSAVLAYVGHLEIKWNRNNCGQRKSPSCSQPCVTDPMIASPTWNTRFTHEKPHVWLFSWSNQLWGLQGLCQQLPFAGTLSVMETNPSTMETGLKLPWFRCPKKNPTSEHAGIITAISLLLRGLPNSCPSGSPASPPLLPPSPKYPAMHITS